MINKKILGVLVCILFVGASVTPFISINVGADNPFGMNFDYSYGFWPSWTSSSTYQPDWNCLTHVSYFSIETNQYGIIDTSSLNTNYQNVRDTAHSNNVKITLALTTPGHNTDYYEYLLAYHREDLVNNVLQVIQDFNADGICLDFEGMDNENDYTGEQNDVLMEQFLSLLYSTLKFNNPNYHISFCVQGWTEYVYRNSNLAQYTDAVFIMGYDFHIGSYSSNPKNTWAHFTGPNSPYNDPDEFDVKDSVELLDDYYPLEKIILGVPFYGWDWECVSSIPRCERLPTNGVSVTMENAKDYAEDNGRLWDSDSSTPWYRYQKGSVWHQCWYEDEESIKIKIQYIESEGLGGIGFWALGYEGNDADVWDLFKTTNSRTYTYDADFDEGILIGLEHDSIHNQLQLSDKSSTYPVLWVANAGEDSLSKWDTENNVELARYHTWFGSLGSHSAWSGPAPSRTCVDSDGNCYVANRHFDTYKPDVIKVYTDTWIDRNGNGILDTSYDANDNGVIEESEMLQMTDSNYNGRIDPEEITDERIAWATQVNGGGVGRSLAIDLDGNIWLGCFNSYRYYKLDGDDGSIIGGPYYVYGHTPYGALVDKYGYLWGASLSSNILKLNTNNPAEYEIYYVPSTYGIALGYDSQDNTLVYFGNNYPYVVFNSYTETYSYPAESWDGSLGVAVDSEGNIAVGSYYAGDVAKYAQDGTIIWAVTGQINSEVRGIVFDSDDNIWAIHRDTSKLCKYNGENGAYMGVYDAGLYPYTYTDATGLGYQGSINVGIWEVVFDSETSDTEWGVISWNSYVPVDTSLWVEVRSSDDGLSWSSWETAVNGINLGSTPDGRYLKIRTTMKILSGETSPVLYDLTVKSGDGSPMQSEQPQLKAPWLGIQKITQGNNAPPYGDYSHYDYGTWDNTYAIDVDLPVGSDVRAPADGVISWYDDDPGGSGGKELAIDHIGPTGESFTTVFLHLSEIIIKSGTVIQGDLVARSGKTGDVTGPHLHFHIWNEIGIRDEHTQPIERLVMKKYGHVDFKEYDARDHDLDNNKIEGQFFESNILSLEEMEWIEAQIQSPVELRVFDSEMRISGVINGEEIIEIPNSVYINETVMIFSTDDTFAYLIVGIDNDTYNLTITKYNPSGNIVFNAFNITTNIGANHLFAIDWGALSIGDEGIAIEIDKDGDGVFERTITSDEELTQDEFILQTETTIDIDPNVLNLNSRGKWITCFIELPEEYNVSNISTNTILLNDIINAETSPVNISDYDEDGIPDLMVKFDRQEVQDILEYGDNVEIKITGELIDGTKFEGLDYIKVI